MDALTSDLFIEFCAVTFWATEQLKSVNTTKSAITDFFISFLKIIIL
tara:strand:- start:2730 stop:2870 length:141 start_codon:yes stop_codon:yes gene_type:complete